MSRFNFESDTLGRIEEIRCMLIQTEEKSVTLSPFGSLALNGAANASKGAGQSWIEMIRTALSQANQSRSDQLNRR
jgi:hypothetical protein